MTVPIAPALMSPVTWLTPTASPGASRPGSVGSAARAAVGPTSIGMPDFVATRARRAASGPRTPVSVSGARPVPHGWFVAATLAVAARAARPFARRAVALFAAGAGASFWLEGSPIVVGAGPAPSVGVASIASIGVTPATRLSYWPMPCEIAPTTRIVPAAIRTRDR